MTERRGDDGFLVEPQRLGDGGGGRRRSRGRGIGLAVVIAAAAAIIAIAWLGPRLANRPSFEVSFFATPVPSATPEPTATPTRNDGGTDVATPLPAITRPEGPVPTGRVAIQSVALQVLDLATGQIVTGPRAVVGRDAVFRAPGRDGWTCICFDEGELTGGLDRTMQIVEIGPTGSVLASTDIAAFPRTPGTETGQQDVATDVDLFAAGHGGVLAVAARGATSWRFAIAPIDVDGSGLGATVDLGELTRPGGGRQPTPESSSEPLDQYLDGPHVRVSPDRRSAFVWGTLQQSAADGVPLFASRAWRVELGADGSIGKVGEAPALRDLPVFCNSAAFAAADRLAWLCPVFSLDPASTFEGEWQLATVGLDGRRMGTTTLAIGTDSYVEPLFDRANGQIYTWDPNHLTIARFDARTLSVERNTFDPLVETSAGVAAGGGPAPVDFHRADSVIGNGGGSLTAAPDGSRLFALGFAPESDAQSGAQPSRGVFVIDRATLALVDRWAPAAEYTAVTALPGGLVAASGMPGVREDGQLALWEASLTIHDAADGRILVRFGQLGTDGPPVVVDR